LYGLQSEQQTFRFQHNVDVVGDISPITLAFH